MFAAIGRRRLALLASADEGYLSWDDRLREYTVHIFKEFCVRLGRKKTVLEKE